MTETQERISKQLENVVCPICGESCALDFNEMQQPVICCDSIYGCGARLTGAIDDSHLDFYYKMWTKPYAVKQLLQKIDEIVAVVTRRREV